ncbi:hypothetical protein ACIHAX_28555 [Nocardia sp. NPDC051929]|uniref:hypothetical protein n=1 Tax=Nocardia sp. NPDC051929 TaxID=3364327 RepID=UPI0037C59630
MGEHRKPEPQYDLGGYRPEHLSSVVPILNLENRSIEDIVDMLAQVRAQSLEERSGMEQSRQNSQLNWELDLLPGQSPEHASAVIAALMESEDPFERVNAVPIVVRLLSHDFENAMGFVRKLIVDDSEEVFDWVAELTSEAIAEGIIDAADAAQIVQVLAKSLRVADRHEPRELGNTAGRRSLGGVATRYTMSTDSSSVTIESGQMQINFIGRE